MDMLLGSARQAAAAMYYMVKYIQKGAVIELQGRVHPHVHHVQCPPNLESSEVQVGWDKKNFQKFF